MTSKIIKMFDPALVEVPADLLNFRVSEDEINAELQRMSKAHAKECFVDTVALYDSVLCELPDGQLLPFYPGRGLHEQGESALMGKTIGDAVAGSLHNAEVDCTVKSILRKSAMEIGDELIRECGIPGVDSLDAFVAEFRTNTERERREMQKDRVARFLESEVIDHTEMEEDAEELTALSTEISKKQYEAMVAAGIDPTIPDFGTDFLTEEEALNNMIEQNKERIRGILIEEYYATEVNPISEEEKQAALEQLCEMTKKSIPELTDYCGEILIKDYMYSAKLRSVLSERAEMLLEDLA